MGLPRFIDAHPSERNTGWHDDVQGITHDGSHWFITQTERLWRIPFTHDLNDPAGAAPGVSTRRRSDFQELSNHHHFGDCVHIAGRVLVPTTSSDEDPRRDPLIAVFRATDLELLDVHNMTFMQSLGWLAVHEQSDTIWTSQNDVSRSSPIRRFKFRRSLLEGSGQLSLSPRPSLVLRDEDGKALRLEIVQGGVIGGDGLLYLANGYPTSTFPVGPGATPGVPRASSGLHVIDPRSGTRLAKSSNDAMPFKFKFDPTRFVREEPEGITWADVDGLGLPGVRGQLHALLLDNDPGDDEVSVLHYAVDQTPHDGSQPIRVVTHSRRDARGVVEALCNPDEPWSPRLVPDVVADIEMASFRYVVNDLLFGPGIHVVRTSTTAAYVRSNPDSFPANNLDNLPPVP